MMAEKFIKSKFKSLNQNDQNLEKSSNDHKQINSITSFVERHSLDINPCETFGSITFRGYENISADHNPKYIRFYSPEANTPHKEVYELLNKFWKFPTPNLLISIIGGWENKSFRNSQLERNFKQILLDIIEKNSIWINGNGLDAGIHKIVSDVVNEYRMISEDEQNQVTLIGISSWRIVRNYENLIAKNCTYTKTSESFNGKFNLNAFSDCFLFCDSGSDDTNNNNIELRVNFEKYLRDNDVPVIQIMFDGGINELEFIHRSLKVNIPLIIIKDSGGLSDLISEIFEHEEIKIQTIEKYSKTLEIEDKEFVTSQQIISEIFFIYKKLVTIETVSEQILTLDKSILRAIILANNFQENHILDLSIRFNCPNFAEIENFHSPNFSTLDAEVLKKSIIEILKRNQLEFLQLFLKYDIEITEILNQENLETLYMTSLESERCCSRDLIKDLITCKKKSFELEIKNSSGKLLNTIYNIIQYLSGYILQLRNISFPNTNIRNPGLNKKLTHEDLFLWALLSGYTEMAMIFWSKCKDNVGWGLVGSIIMNKMKSLISLKGQTDISCQFTEASKKFEERSIALVKEASERNQRKTYKILTRPLETLNNMSCLEIAVNGNLLNFLNQSACRSYSKKEWMGDLSPFFPMWKILLTILFSPFLFPILIILSYLCKKETNSHNDKFNVGNLADSDKGVCKISFSSVSNRNNRNKEFVTNCSKYIKTKYNKITSKKAFLAFYKAPVVKFIVYLVNI